MRTLGLTLSLSTLVLAGCASTNPAGPGASATPPFFPQAAGARQARADLAAGRLQLLEAGTIGISAPGVPVGDPRFSNLPRRGLPGGCTNPNASAWYKYAEAYNAVIVADLQKDHAH